MDINTATGEKVVFVGDAGWEGEVSQALKYLTHGQEYTVDHLDVGRSSSTVVLQEFPNKHFNTVMFKNNALEWKRFDWFREVCYMGFGTPTTQEEFAAMPFNDGHVYEEVLKLRPAVVVEEEPSAPVPSFKTAKNTLVTARRYSDQQLTVLNPKDDQEVIDLFMEQFGYEPFTFNKMWFDKHFDPLQHFGHAPE